MLSASLLRRTLGLWVLAVPLVLTAADSGAALRDLGGAATATSKGSLDLLERLAQASATESERPGANPSDVNARADLLGSEWSVTFAFVRDQIATEPYTGQLRGAAGALAARAGNSFDKSQLLVALLAAKGHEARLMKGSLSAEAAEPLMKRFLAADSLQGPLGQYLAVQAPNEEAKRLAQATGLPAEKISAKLAELAAQSQRATQATREKTGAQTTYLRGQLARSAVKLGQPFDDTQSELAAALAEHYWVQLRTQSDPETWTDLDPSFPAAKPGQVFASEGSTYSDTPNSARLRFQLVYRRTVNGSLEDKNLLELTLAASDALLRPARFTIQPDEPLPAMSELVEKSSADAKALLRAIKRFRGVFQSGTEVSASDPFDFLGETAKKREPSAAGLGRSIGGGFGLGGGDDDEPKDIKFVELDVVLSFEGLGHDVPAQRRVLYTAEDTKSDCRSPLVTWDLLLQPQVLSPRLLDYATLRHHADTLTPAVRILRAGKLSPDDINQLSSSPLAPMPKLLVALASLRQDQLARSLRSHPEVTAAFLTPQLTIGDFRTCTCPDKPTCGSTRIDIVENGIRFIPRRAEAAAEAAACALEQGVADTFLEAQVLTAASDAPVETPTAIFEKARIAQRTVKAFSPGDEKLPLNLSDRAWIADCESPQRLILVADLPAREAASVWWSLDPKTGTILGRASGGTGDALTERNILEQKIAIGALKCYGSAAADFVKSRVKSGQFSDAASWNFGISAFACTTDMVVGFVKPELGAGAAGQFVDWAAPQVIDFLRNAGPQ